MKIAVIAANGRLGRVFVMKALAQGHSVRAGVRGSSTLPTHPQLTVVKCDATKPEDLMELLKGQDVVVSALGHVKGSPPSVQTTATEQIIAVMKDAGLSRYVDITGTGVRFPGDKITLIDRLLNFGVQLIDPNRVKDGRTHQDLLMTSKLDWTTIRVLKLQNVAARPFQLKTHGPTKVIVGREEAAEAMLQVINQHTFIKQAPIIGSVTKFAQLRAVEQVGEPS